MHKQLNIYTDRLKDGFSTAIEEELSPDFLEVSEESLRFPEKVVITGDAYLADDHLILRLTIRTVALIPCLICNTATSTPISIEDFYHGEPLAQLSSPIFNYCEPLREAILLQVPAFIECNGGACPERKTVSKFLKQKNPSSDPGLNQYPFADLDK